MKTFQATLLFVMCTFALPVSSQPAYPSRPVTIVVGFAAGGLADTLARSVADFARSKRGATVIVENRPGAVATIATERVARSAPDGYTLTLASPSPIWVVPAVQDVRYDPMQDLAYIAQLITQPMPLYVRADSPFKTYEDVLTYARANPGGFRWGTAGARGLAEIVVG
jgi:tripartite-type tricarboxylate transporter receptor subunit TctC